MKKEEGESIFDFDPDSLDEEWRRQPRLYHEYAILVANLRAAWEQCKAQRDVVEAELARDIRIDPEKHGYTKPTEDVVKKTITLQRRYTIANNDVLKAKHDLDIAQAAVDALDQKKKAMEVYVQLLVNDYHSAPKAQPGSREKVEEWRKGNFSKRVQDTLNKD